MSAILAHLSSTAAEHAEWQLRCDMAAVFRVAARLGWNEQIGNHNSLMLAPSGPGERPTFLINPRGYLFQELTASSLIVCDLDGNVLRGTGELRKVAFHIHARIHLQNPNATCIVHVHPRWLTALSMLAEPEITLSHHNNLILNDRVAIDHEGVAPADSHAEGDRLAAALGEKSILLMGGHGVTVVGPTVHDAFDECHAAERTAMYQLTAMSTGRALRALPDSERRHWHGPWGEKMDARLHLKMLGCILMRGVAFLIVKSLITQPDRLLIRRRENRDACHAIKSGISFIISVQWSPGTSGGLMELRRSPSAWAKRVSAVTGQSHVRNHWGHA